MDEGEANRVFTYMVDKVQELGLSLLPKEYLDQFGRLGGGDQEPQLPSEGSRPVEVEDLEKEHEDWDSSFPSTQGPGSPWTSGDESLETKLARVPHHEALAVATMHAINQEKKDRREEKKNDVPKASIRWSPLTKGGFEDFKYYCRHGVPLETLGPKKFEKVQDFETSQIQWGPITKAGVANFLGFGQANVNVENLDFMQLVDFAVGLKTFHDIPQDAPTHIQASIRYIKELYDYWNVWDVADIEGWLNEGNYYNPNRKGSGSAVGGDDPKTTKQEEAPRSTERPVPDPKETMSKHLDSNVINSCLDREHKPINPHSQRLLTAEARSAAKIPKANPKKPAKKTPEKIDKSPADEGGKGGGKRKKTDKEKEAESGAIATKCHMLDRNTLFDVGVHVARLDTPQLVQIFRSASCSTNLFVHLKNSTASRFPRTKGSCLKTIVRKGKNGKTGTPVEELHEAGVKGKGKNGKDGGLDVPEQGREDSVKGKGKKGKDAGGDVPGRDREDSVKGKGKKGKVGGDVPGQERGDSVKGKGKKGKDAGGDVPGRDREDSVKGKGKKGKDGGGYVPEQDREDGIKGKGKKGKVGGGDVPEQKREDSVKGKGKKGKVGGGEVPEQDRGDSVKGKGKKGKVGGDVPEQDREDSVKGKGKKGKDGGGDLPGQDREVSVKGKGKKGKAGGGDVPGQKREDSAKGKGKKGKDGGGEVPGQERGDDDLESETESERAEKGLPLELEQQVRTELEKLDDKAFVRRFKAAQKHPWIDEWAYDHLGLDDYVFGHEDDFEDLVSFEGYCRQRQAQEQGSQETEKGKTEDSKKDEGKEAAKTPTEKQVQKRKLTPVEIAWGLKRGYKWAEREVQDHRKTKENADSLSRAGSAEAAVSEQKAKYIELPLDELEAKYDKDWLQERIVRCLALKN
eukprot:symbB.v1.2.018925.t1/scaffold1517.1/size114154/8